MNPRAAFACGLLACAAALAWPAGAAHEGGLDSPACREALAALQAKESAALRDAATAREALPQIQTLRQRAAVECLGGRGASAVEPGRLAQAPVSLPLVTPLVTPPVAHAGPARPPITPMPPRIEMPVSVTGCDAAGCWASDGSRLNRVGNALLGPRGICRSAGVTVQCP